MLQANLPDLNGALLEAVGIDGCRAGWVIAYRVCRGVSFSVVERLVDLNPLLAPTASIMIDMPIGLTADSPVRDCDRLARERLKPYRASSIFGVPPRAVTRCEDYETAGRLSRDLSNQGISKQTFYLFPKIRELDHWLVDPHRKGSWHECHPEVAFAQLNRGVPLALSKKTDQGRAERLGLLTTLGALQPAMDQVLGLYRRRDVLPDDLVDAAVCLLTAEQALENRLCLPEEAPVDEQGLRMEIVVPR